MQVSFSNKVSLSFIPSTPIQTRFSAVSSCLKWAFVFIIKKERKEKGHAIQKNYYKKEKRKKGGSDSVYKQVLLICT